MHNMINKSIDIIVNLFNIVRKFVPAYMHTYIVKTEDVAKR